MSRLQGNTAKACNLPWVTMHSYINTTPVLTASCAAILSMQWHAGKAPLMAIMNVSYTYAAFYPTSIPATAGGPFMHIGFISILTAATRRARRNAAVPLTADVPLLCTGGASDAQAGGGGRDRTGRDTGSAVYSMELSDDTEFPVMRPTDAVYRPNDTCQFDLSQPSAPGLRAQVNVLYMAQPSTLAFTTDRALPLNEVSSRERLVLRNDARTGGVTIQVKGDTMSLWFYAGGAAGYSFLLAFQQAGSDLGSSWTVTVRCSLVPWRWCRMQSFWLHSFTLMVS